MFLSKRFKPIECRATSQSDWISEAIAIRGMCNCLQKHRGLKSVEAQRFNLIGAAAPSRFADHRSNRFWLSRRNSWSRRLMHKGSRSRL